ncbi:hypothetical protein niasHT_020329 [Heterodera trifolii]|uniref:Uncharacterized protein n=1 Tax=Heterodera trifolii TaxID=157864 RepID=A0ABD2K443_9BILA
MYNNRSFMPLRVRRLCLRYQEGNGSYVLSWHVRIQVLSQCIDKTKCNDQAEIKRVCGDCGQYSCVPRPGLSGIFCCGQNYELQCISMTKYQMAKLSKQFKIREDCSDLVKRMKMKSTGADWHVMKYRSNKLSKRFKIREDCSDLQNG